MYSTISLENYIDTKFKDEEELNKKILKFTDQHEELLIQNNNLESHGVNGFSGSFYENYLFACLLSKYIIAGKIRLIYKNEDCYQGYEISPNKIDALTFLALNTEELKKYNGFKELKEDLNDIHESLFIPQWFDKSHFEDMLDKKLTDTQFQRIKDHLIDGSGDYLAESMSESVREELEEILINIPEIFE
ncbi:MAG: hypothetical protein ACYDDE_00590 [bacterium]